METQEYIESGILELYVYGVLDESETQKISALEKSNVEIKNEIVDIEKSIINLSSSFAPNVSAAIFSKIKAELELKHVPVIEMKPKSNASAYLGWAASVALLVGTGYFYNKSNDSETKIATIEKEKIGLQKSIFELDLKNKSTQTALNVVRDANNKVINLAGQAVDPTATAKIYWNKNTKAVFVDASGLPEPPEGMVYQIWSLKMSPLTPTSIGLLNNFKDENSRIFAVSASADAEGFGITLEPAGGSKSPTMEKLYTLGTVI